jgi:hypothetical protein
MKNPLPFFSLFLVFTWLCFPATAQKKLRLRYDLYEGKSFSYKSSTEQEIEQRIMDQIIEMRQAFSYVYDFLVLEKIKKKEYRIQVTYRSLYFKQSSLDQHLEYDSENPKEELPAPLKIFDALKGKSFEMLMNTRGEILALSGIDSLLEKVFLSLDMFGKDDKKLIMEAIQRQFNEKSMKENMEKLFILYPDKKIKEGHSWTNITTNTILIPMHITTKYTWNETENAALKLSYDALCEASEEGDSLVIGYLIMHYDLQGKEEGNIQIDKNSGMILEAHNKHFFKGTILVNTDKKWPVEVRGIHSIIHVNNK